MIIVLTGHRNCFVNPADLVNLRDEFPDAIWETGGAFEGFDLQVKGFCEVKGIHLIEKRPKYSLYPNKRYAPIARDEEMVRDDADLVVACYDGREKGGTKATIDFANQYKKSVRILKAFSF